MTSPTVTRKLAAILYADVAGYSRLTGADEIGTHRRLAAALDRITRAVTVRNGRVVHYAGDAVLAEFPSVVAAVESALAIQRETAEKNGALPSSEQLLFRIGLNLGEVIVDRDDIYGDGVNIAARLESLAPAGGICVSAAVHDQIRGRMELSFRELGEVSLKNIAAPVKAYQIDRAGTCALATVMDVESRRELPLPERPSIAVLPFVNMSGDPGQDYLGDGLALDITTELGAFPDLFVIASNSSFAYKGRRVPAEQIGRELGVRYLLEGSVRGAGPALRITAALSEVRRSRQLWSQRYQIELRDVFAAQDDITAKVVNAITPELIRAEAEHGTGTPTHSPTAWEYRSRAQVRWWRWTKADLAEAERLAREAVRLEPTNPEGLALLAGLLWAQAVSDFVHGSRALVSEALSLARRAVALDGLSARAHCAFAVALLSLGEFDPAVAESARALELAPGSSEALLVSGHVLAFAGPSETAITRLAEAIRLNPKDPQDYGRYQALAAAYFALERYEEAVEATSRVTRLLPEWYPAHVLAAAGLARLGRVEEASSALAAAREMAPSFSLDDVAKLFPYRDPAPVEHIREGLRAAGLTSGSGSRATPQ